MFISLPADIILILCLLSLAVFFFLRYRMKMAHLNAFLSNERSKLISLISSLGDGVILLDSHDQVLVYNTASTTFLNPSIPNQPAASKYLTSLEQFLTTESLLQTVREALSKSRANNQVIKLEEIKLNDKNLVIEVEPVRDQHSGWMIMVIRDITLQRHLDRVHQEFTAMMIHELRTPLTTISYSTHMLLNDLNKLSTQDLSSQIELIQSTSSRLLGLVNDLLDVSKIESGKFQIVRQNQDFKTVVEEKIAVFKPLVEQKNLELESNIDPGLQSFSFDSNRVGQVLDNLISNALKYTKQGKVSIHVHNNSGEIVTDVIDTGDGISPEDLPKLFSKFQQFGKGKTGDVKGTGLGLVVAKGIIEAHGGKMWAKSDGLGKGSTFSFSIPYQPQLASIPAIPITPMIDQPPTLINPWDH